MEVTLYLVYINTISETQYLIASAFYVLKSLYMIRHL